MKRREFLGGLAVLGGLSTLAVGDDAPDYEDSQESLQSLADTIDETDITDPMTTAQLIRDIEAAKDTADSGVHSKTTDRARRIARLRYQFRDFISFLPFVSPPSEMSIESDISATKSALDYYDALLNYLNVTDQIHRDLERVEYDILDKKTDIPDSVDRSDALATHESRLTDFEELDERLPTDSPVLSQMLPDRETVREDATTLVDLYRAYGRVQESYLSASSMIEDGALERENGEFEMARETFSEAVSTVDLNLTESLFESSLGAYALSIGRYGEVLRLYQAGISTMVESCEDNPKSEDSLQQYGDGLERLFDAQQLVAEMTHRE